MKKLYKVIILLELHPETYNSNNRNISSLINLLFDNSYKLAFVESAGMPCPKIFMDNKYKPIRIANNRGLFNNISKEFILKYAFTNVYDVSSTNIFYHKTLVQKKAIRSICLHKDV